MDNEHFYSQSVQLRPIKTMEAKTMTKMHNLFGRYKKPNQHSLHKVRRASQSSRSWTSGHSTSSDSWPRKRATSTDFWTPEYSPISGPLTPDSSISDNFWDPDHSTSSRGHTPERRTPKDIPALEYPVPFEYETPEYCLSRRPRGLFEMCIETTYRALCGHYTLPVYDFCQVALEQARSGMKEVVMHLWRWSGRDQDQISSRYKRVQPCRNVKVKRKRHDPYWQKRACDGCRVAVTNSEREAKTRQRKSSHTHTQAPRRRQRDQYDNSRIGFMPYL